MVEYTPILSVNIVSQFKSSTFRHFSSTPQRGLSAIAELLVQFQPKPKLSAARPIENETKPKLNFFLPILAPNPKPKPKFGRPVIFTIMAFESLSFPNRATCQKSKKMYRAPIICPCLLQIFTAINLHDAAGLTDDRYSHPSLPIILCKLFRLIMLCKILLGSVAVIVPVPKIEDYRSKKLTCEDIFIVSHVFFR